MTIFLMVYGRFSIHVPPFWRLIPTKHGDSTQVQNRIKVEPPNLVKADGWKGRPYHRVSPCITASLLEHWRLVS